MKAVKSDKEWKLAFPLSQSEYEADRPDLEDESKFVWREWPDTTGYVANEEGNGTEHGFLMQAKVAEKEVGARISTIEDPWAIAIAPDGAKAYVVNYEPPHGGLVPVTLSGDRSYSASASGA